MLKNARLLRGMLLLLLAITTASSSLVHAYQKDAAKEKALADIYAKLDDAFGKRDFQAITAFEADDLQAKQQDGKVINREEFDTGLKQTFEKFDKDTVITSASKIESVDAGKDKDDSVAVVAQTIKMTVKDPTGANHELVITAKSRDTWHYSDKGWKMKLSEELGGTVMLDGKEFQPNQ